MFQLKAEQQVFELLAQPLLGRLILLGVVHFKTRILTAPVVFLRLAGWIGVSTHISA
ncbi:hypothetical protein [Rheinheimera sp.]|uniref:hypothetical protein n=1 Tax=Rheinheimera sp. TaxID=1869214 RepID=UPI003D2785C5